MPKRAKYGIFGPKCRVLKDLCKNKAHSEFAFVNHFSVEIPFIFLS